MIFFRHREGVWKNYGLLRCLLIMKLIVVLILVFSFQSIAKVYSQRTVSLTLKSANVREVLDAIENNTDFRFVYSERKINETARMDISVDQGDVFGLLDRVFSNSALTYTVIAENLIAVVPKGESMAGKVLGRVVDEGGVPLPGASVRVKGKTAATATDVNGSFTIAAEANDVLLVSFVGYQVQEVLVERRANITIKLVPLSKGLQEVVVVGYGTQSKRAVTGAVASISYNKFKDRSFNDVSQALAGQLPGVNITQSQGAPGSSPSIRIRGITSISAGTTPLFVVDGMPMENFNLSLINPQDIASVDVLKDASSAAIYGSRGANGVILISTKVGKAGQTNINASYEFGKQDVARRVKMMDAQQYIQYYIDAHNNAWTDQGGNAADPNEVRGGGSGDYQIHPDFTGDPARFGRGTDWQDVMFRSAPSHNVQVSMNGGTEKTQYLVSAAYLDQTAVLDNNYYDRLSLRSNVKQKISDSFTAGLNIAFTGVFDNTQGVAGKSDVVSLGLQSAPIYPRYNENGNLGYLDPNSEWYRFAGWSVPLWHPYSMTREINRQNKSFNTLGVAYLEYKIVDGLRFRTSLSGNLYNTRLNTFRHTNQKYGYSNALPAQADNSTRYMLNWLSENTLSYERQFGSHNLSVLAGYTAQKQRDEYSFVTTGNFPNDLVETLNGGTVTGGSGFAQEWSLLSYLARANYNYLNRYFLTATIRRDGSSRFGRKSRWGYFPSVSASWLASDEGFLKDVSWISNLKLRASYGVVGNNQIPNYGPISLLVGGAGNNYVWMDALAAGLSIQNIENKDLKWEKTTQANVGIDLGAFNNRINLAVDLYNSTTNGLLLNVPIPDITGFASQLSNVGKMRNRGIEFNLGTKNLVGAFNWSTDFNLSVNRNKVLEVGADRAPIMYTDNVVTVKTEIGQPMSNFYGYQFDGVFKDQAAVDASPHYGTTRAGDPIIRDVNKDGKIDANDRTVLGNYQPDFITALTNTFDYKGFEFSFMLQASYGGEIANNMSRFVGGMWTYNTGRNNYADVANYWKSENEPGDGTHFRPNTKPTGLQEQFSSYWVEDASFLRVKNIRLSYTLPKAWISRSPVKSARLFINAENVHLFSRYRNYDPENSTYSATSYSATTATSPNVSTSAIPSGAMLGVDYGSYPMPRIITFGARFGF